MKFQGTIHYRLAADALRLEAPRAVPYATAIMLTKLAGDVRGGVQQELPRVFDRPTPFTLRGVSTKGATRADLTAQVFIPESQAAGGRKAREYMRPGAAGAAYGRSQKKTEFLLTRLGVLPLGWVTTPGRGAKLDSHGNLSGRIYAQIINVLQLKAQVVGGRGVAERAKKTARRLGVDAIYFVVRPGGNRLGKNGGWLPPGVWRRLSRGRIEQVLKFVRTARYEPRLNMRKVGVETVRRNVGVRWREAASIITARFKQRTR